MNRDELNMKIWAFWSWIVVSRCIANGGAGVSLLEKSIIEGENPVCHLQSSVYGSSSESHVPRDWSAKWVVNFISKLNMGSRPIANKYHEGKMKRTLKRELKVPEIAERKRMEPVLLGEIVAVVWVTLVWLQRKRSSECECLPFVMHLALCVSDSTLARITPRSCELGLRASNVPVQHSVCVLDLLTYNGAHSTRLETRTKESNICASSWVCKPCCAMKVIAGIFAPAADRSIERGLSMSTSVRTRKMVNYACEGWSQGKLWWRLVAILTCKSFVIHGYRGERLIEPSSSWFPPKFPSG